MYITTIYIYVYTDTLSHEEETMKKVFGFSLTNKMSQYKSQLGTFLLT